MTAQTAPVRLAIVGYGKIARDQHAPAVGLVDGIELVAVASHHGDHETVPTFRSLEDLLASDVAFDAVSVCTPPQQRRAVAAAALAAGKHVFLEKPPGATQAEIGPLVAAAKKSKLALFASWHSRYAPAVEAARRFLARREIREVEVTWKEDVNHWHPGQDWIFEAGGLGVFDPGINALSIVTRILPKPFFLTEGTLHFPANRDAPIAADLAFSDEDGLPIRCAFDFRQTGPQTWDIRIETDGGQLLLSLGAAQMRIDGKKRIARKEREYQGLYRRFVSLCRRRAIDVDMTPHTHVADAFLLGRRVCVEPFEWEV